MGITTTTTSTLEIKKDNPVELKEQRDNDRFHKWFNTHVKFTLNGMVTLKQCYDSYKKFLTEDVKKLSLTKRTFAARLRSELEPYINDDTVFLVTRKKVLIAGISLKDEDQFELMATK